MKDTQTPEERKDPNKRILSHSSLSWFKRSPAYFKYMVEHPEATPETDAMIFGNLFHTMVLEPQELEARFFVLNEDQRPEPTKTMASKLNKEWKAAQYAAAGDKKKVKSSDITNAKLMAAAVMKQAGELITNATAIEKPISWRKDGVDFRGFIDIDNPLYMADLKTAADSTPDKWQRKAFWDWNSHRQAAMYLDGDANGIYTGEKDFYFIVVEKAPPYLVSINMVSKNKIAEGMTQYKELLQGIKRARKYNKWPDFDPKINIWE